MRRTLKQVVYENDSEISILYDLIEYKRKNPDYENIFLLLCAQRFESQGSLTGFQINILNELFENIGKKPLKRKKRLL